MPEPPTEVSPSQGPEPSTEDRRYRLGFRPDIEGLRAVAVLAVLGFHATAPLFGGGYVGVDIFFVISGFLITALLLGEVEKTGRISLPAFYARRARRILPAAGLVLLATAAGSALFLSPLRRHDVALDIIFSALNAGNWRFVALQTDYLAEGLAPSPVLHFWSLGVEEQFYLVWAPLAVVLVLLARRRPYRFLALAIGVLTGVSMALSLWWTWTSAPLAYLGSPSRAWQFGVGALVALALPRLAARPGAHARHPEVRTGRVLLGFAGLAAVATSIAVFTKETPFPGTAALLPTLGAAAIIVAGVGAERPVGVGRWLATPPMRAMGRLSYSWYLWHWPVLIFAEAQWGEQPWPVRLALVLGSAVPAWLTMRLVEDPIRRGRRLAALPRRGLALGAAAILLPVAASGAVSVNAQSTMRAVAAAAASTQPDLVGATEGPHLIEQSDLAANQSPVPHPLNARGDIPAVYSCQTPDAWTESPPCLFATKESPHRIVLMGDSHASQWFPAVYEVASQRSWAVEVLAKNGCPVATITIVNKQTGQPYETCDQWREASFQRIEKGPKPEAIIVGTLRRVLPSDEATAAGWQTSLERLSRVAPVVYLRDSPYPGRDIPECMSAAEPGTDPCAFPREPAVPPDPTADLIAAGRWERVHLLDLNDVLCPGETCPTVIDGVLLYRDHSHLTATAAALFGPRLDQALTEQGILP